MSHAIRTMTMVATTCLLATTHTLLAGSATSVVAVGAPTPGSDGNLVSLLNDPYLTRDGRVGCTGAINVAGANVSFVWFDGAIVWLNTDALPTMLSGAEATMGVSDSGSWIYSPSEGGLDSVWKDGASLAIETQPAPGLPGQFLSFCSRPQMNADGTPTFVAGITAVQGGGAQFRALYSGTTVVLAGGDTVSGETISGTGPVVGFPYDFSSDGSNYIAKAILSAPNASNDVVVMNDEILARESESTGAGDHWQTFNDVKTNNVGDYAFIGDTDALTKFDGFLAFNDQLVVREGDTIADGYTLIGNPSAVGLNDARQVGAIWNSTGGEVLFVLTPTRTGALTLAILAKVGDPVDLDGDGLDDATITDFNASTGTAPALDLPRQCRVCVNVDVQTAAGASAVAIVCVALPPAMELANLDGLNGVNAADLAILLGSWGGPGIADLNCDGTVDAADLAILLGSWS